MASRTFTFWAAGITLAAPAAAFAAPLALSASDQAGGGARIEAHWLDGRPAPAARTRVEGGVLIVTFDEAFEADLASLAAGAPKSIAFARRDADGRTLRVALRNASSVSVSASGASRIIALAPAPKPQAAHSASAPASTTEAPEVAWTCFAIARISFGLPIGTSARTALNEPTSSAMPTSSEASWPCC